MPSDETMDVDAFYERTSEALEEIADEDTGENRTVAEWINILSQKLGAAPKGSDDDEDDDDDDEDDEDDEDDDEDDEG